LRGTLCKRRAVLTREGTRTAEDLQTDGRNDRGEIRTGGRTRRADRQRRRTADEADLERAATKIGLPSDASRYISYRILPYARFCEDQASNSRLAYYWLRIPAITLAAIVPALIAANLGAGARWIATGLGIVVAATTGTEHFLNVGARWRHYRATVESLKSETWTFLELAGPYATFNTHDSGLQAFVEQAERMLRADWTAYVTIVNTETTTQTGSQSGALSPPKDG
jgi:hypothetical protein